MWTAEGRETAREQQFFTTRLPASSAGDRSLWQPGGRRGQVGRPPGKVRGVLGKGTAPVAPRYDDHRAPESRSVRSPRTKFVEAALARRPPPDPPPPPPGGENSSKGTVLLGQDLLGDCVNMNGAPRMRTPPRRSPPVWRAELSCPGGGGCTRSAGGRAAVCGAPAGRVPVLGRFHHPAVHRAFVLGLGAEAPPGGVTL